MFAVLFSAGAVPMTSLGASLPPVAIEEGAESGAEVSRPAANAPAAGAMIEPDAPDADTSPPARFIADTISVELAGEERRVDIYRPVAAVTVRAAIVAHGFNRSARRHRDLGQALALAGITAVIPDLPHVLDIWGNGGAIVELADRLAAGALGLPPLERSRLVLIGTSAGGLATILAAAELPGLAGWIGLDPVDRTGSGESAAARLSSPAVVLLGPSRPCNLFGSGRAIAKAVPGLIRAPVIGDASHCDFEGPTNRFCEVVCGGSSAEIQARIRDETVAAALELLNVAAGRPEVDESLPNSGDAAASR
jgi:pimeloyl-ACP methyl ester carboxylesterase